jgi:branched-chain amino acid transport system permease protein
MQKGKGIPSSKMMLAAVFLGFIAVLPVFQKNQYMIHLIILFGIYIIYSSSWNLLAYSGQASLGHAAFLGISGYVSTLTVIHLGISPWIGLLVGALVASVIGLLIGLTCVRLREWFLAMVTFGFAVIADTVILAFDWITQGSTGYATPSLVNTRIEYYYVVMTLAIITIVTIYLIIKSRIGLAFSTIRENELEAENIGVNTTRYKLLAFTLSAFFAGVAGGVLAHYIGYISDQVFSFDHSFMPLIMAVTGGLNTVGGPIIGSILILSIWEALNIINPIQRMIVIGVFLTLIVIFVPRGVFSIVKKYFAFIK